MHLSRQAYQWSAHFGPSLTNGQNKLRNFNRETKNAEGMHDTIIPNVSTFTFQDQLVCKVRFYQILVMKITVTCAGINLQRTVASQRIRICINML